MVIPSDDPPATAADDVRFIAGVVEGFYGRPWSSEQRRILFRRMDKMGLNTYLYAPKDDCKHRMYWRELYSVEEADHLTNLIEAACEQNIDFVYAISPGLDITFSSTKDVTLLKKKLEQVASFGCQSFALLFDDIEVEMCEADKEIFQSFAAAQVSVTNEVYQHLSQPRFLFCPTEYCATRAVPTVTNSEYLNTIGTKLLPHIDILWTGPKVVSKNISVDSIKELSAVLRRPPVIWDNIHANDYDRRRLFLGPYEGRSPTLIPHLRGVLTNPNCEFEGNYVAMHTLAQWTRANPETATAGLLPGDSPLRAEIRLETESEGPDAELPCDLESYNPRQALAVALTDWHEEMSIDVRAFLKRQPFPVTTGAPVVVPTCGTVTATTSSLPAPILPGGVPNLNAALPSVMGNLNELANLEVNTSYMQPAMSDVPLNSFADSDSETDVESVDHESLEPMDCAFTPTSTPSSSVSSSPELGVLPPSVEEFKAELLAPMQVDNVCPESTVPMVLTKEELSLLVDCFYLPYEHGNLAVTMLLDLIWLQGRANVVCEANGRTATDEQKAGAVEWQHRYTVMKSQLSAYWSMVEHFVAMPNQAIVIDLYPYIWDLKNILTVVQSFLDWMMLGHLPYISVCALNGYPHSWRNNMYTEAFCSGDHEPWVFQGGLQAEFQRLLPLHGSGDLLVPSVIPAHSVPMFNVRPYRHTDESAVYSVCKQTCQEAVPESLQPGDPEDLLPDKLVGGHLTLSPQYCFVVENASGEVCGYALATLDASIFSKQLEQAWMPEMTTKYPLPVPAEMSPSAQEVISSFHNHEAFQQEAVPGQFPSLIQVAMSEHTDESAVRRVMAAAFAALSANGSHGAHVSLPLSAKTLAAGYTKLGFFDICAYNSPADTHRVLARLI